MQKVFRPPESCSICRDVQQVDRLAAVDPVIFEQRYSRTELTLIQRPPRVFQSKKKRSIRVHIP